MVELRVGVTAGRDPVEENVSVVGKEIAVEKGGIEIVVGIVVGTETGEEAVVGREGVAVGTEEAEVKVGEAGVVIGIGEGIQGMYDAVEVESDAGGQEAEIGDVAVVETVAGIEKETVE